MTATKPHSPQFDSYNQQSLINGGIDGDIEAGASSDGDSAELKQRKKAIILAKQLERRQQQEAIRQKREEERARKAEELRQKEEEAAMKKLLEKTRKETIFQAYIDKKKQLQEESLTNYFGHPNSSLLSAKSKFHSTQRLKPAVNKQQQQQQHFAFDLKQNLMDQFDQASVISDRSTSTQQQMKSKLFVVFVWLQFVFVPRLIYYYYFGVVVGVVNPLCVYIHRNCPNSRIQYPSPHVWIMIKRSHKWKGF